MIIPFENKHPKIGKDVFIVPTAVVIGNVTIGDGSGIWYGTVVRADIAHIDIGQETYT